MQNDLPFLFMLLGLLFLAVCHVPYTHNGRGGHGNMGLASGVFSTVCFLVAIILVFAQ